MRIPRRVPWASLVELDELCNWIFADGSSLSSSAAAIDRLTAWRAITPLPHALEATLSLLVAARLDDEYNKATRELRMQHDGPSDSADRMCIFSLGVRQGYATAIVRMVNGLVDPLQSGMYARSISAIAAQIGLPQWLVELRHAATHEDLPSLELLRSGVQESLAWLLDNYFTPMLSANADQASVSVQLSPVSPILKRYKHTMKLIIRDASLAHQYKSDLRDSHRALERWISEAKVTAMSALVTGWNTSQGDEVIEEKERWALERLCDALTDKGSLVPVSSKKRLVRSRSDPELPQELMDVWTPLLTEVTAAHPLFPSILVTSIIDKLSSNAANQEELDAKSEQSSSALCLVAWCLWCVRRWNSDITEDTALLRKRDLVSLLLMAHGPGEIEERSRSTLNVLLLLLMRNDWALQLQLDDLKAIAWRRRVIDASVVDDAAIDLMESRLRCVLSDVSSTARSHAMLSAGSPSDCQRGEGLPSGWSVPPIEAWKPYPIGLYQ